MRSIAGTKTGVARAKGIAALRPAGGAVANPAPTRNHPVMSTCGDDPQDQDAA